MPSTWINNLNQNGTKHKSAFYSLILACLIGVNFIAFYFQNLAAFRDFTVLDYASNWDTDPNLVQRVLLFLFNFWRGLDIPAHILTTFYFSLIFGVGIFLTFIYSYKIYKQFCGFDFQPENQLWSQLIIFSLSWFYTYNPFIFERFLMGQDKIILAHFLVIPYLFYLLETIKNIKFTERIKVKLKLVLWLVVIAVVNLHYSVLVLGLTLFLIGLVFQLNLRYLQQSILLIIGTGFAVALSFILNYGWPGYSTSFFTENIGQNNLIQEQIIQAFSPKPIETDYNPLIKILSGAGSWMSPTFYELDQIKSDLGWLSNFNPYFNQNIQIIIFILFGWLIYYFIRKTFSGDTTSLKLPLKRFVIVFPVSIAVLSILSLGFAFNWSRSINQYFYYIPGSYLFRESLKIYGLISVLFVLFVLTGLSRHSKPVQTKVKLISGVISAVICIVSFLPFASLSDSLNYINYPSIYTSILNKCQGEKLLWLPNYGYTTPSYSKTFIPNPAKYLDQKKCQIQPLNYTELNTQNGTNALLLIDADKQSLEINQKINQILVQVPAEKNKIVVDSQRDQVLADDFIQYLKKSEIKWLVIDSSNYSSGARLNTILGSRLTAVEVQNSIFLYKI